MDLSELENKTRKQIEILLKAYEAYKEFASEVVEVASRLGKEFNIDPYMVIGMLMMNMKAEQATNDN